MKPRDLVKSTLEFSSPSRIPRELWTLPWAYNHYPEEMKKIHADFPNDIVASPSFLKKNIVTRGDPYEIGTYVDEWGCTFTSCQRGVVGEVKQPKLQTWDDLETLRLPEEAFTVDVDKVNEFCRSTDLFVESGSCARPFERMQFLRGSANLYMDIGERSDEFYKCLKIVHNYYLKEMEVWAKTEVDSLNFMDDWGSQRSLLIKPSLWREIFKPLYKEYIDLAHSYGKYAFMHTDGYTADIIPDMIELGLDAINSQLFVMDIEKLGEQYKGKITFWGEIDRQHLLATGTVDDVIKGVHRVYDALYQNGGVIAQCEFGAGGKPENVYTVFKTWQELSN